MKIGRIISHYRSIEDSSGKVNTLSPCTPPIMGRFGESRVQSIALRWPLALAGGLPGRANGGRPAETSVAGLVSPRRSPDNEAPELGMVGRWRPRSASPRERPN